MKTIPAKAELLEALGADLEAVVPPEGQVVFYNDFPSGFILSKRRPAICGAWVYTRGTETGFRSLYSECLERMATEPTYVIRIAANTRTQDLQPAVPVPGDPFNALMERCQTEDLKPSVLYRISRLDLACIRRRGAE